MQYVFVTCKHLSNELVLIHVQRVRIIIVNPNHSFAKETEEEEQEEVKKRKEEA
jgi:Zn-dependent M16 (insulinase) family peptidase